MSKQTQDRVLDTIRKQVESREFHGRKFTLVIDYTLASNVGIMHAPLGRAVVGDARVRFDFQDAYATFRDANQRDGGRIVHLDYSDPEAVEAGVMTVAAFLRGGK